MKKLLAAALSLSVAAVSFGLTAAAADSAITEYTAYPFESGMPTGFNKPGGANTALDEGFGNSKHSMKVVLGADQKLSSVQMPVYWISGKEYKISFYFKPLEGGTIQTIRPLLYDSNSTKKAYAFTESAGIKVSDMKSVGDGWYYYSTVYNLSNTNFVTGSGTIEIRTTRSNYSDNSAYLLDDVIVEPVEGYSNVLFEEDFQGTTTKVQNYNTASTVSVKKADNNSYAEVVSTSTFPRMRSKSNIEFKANTKYRFTFDVLGVSDNTNDTKCMWGINTVSGYFYNNDAEKMSTSEWRTYTVDYTPSEDITNYIFSTAQSDVTNAAYAIDNIKLEEAVPKINSVTADNSPEVSVPMNISVDADAGLTYKYRIMTSSDGEHYITVSSGNGTRIEYTPSAADTGKYIKVSVTAYDTNHAYNTVETVSENKVKGAFLEFTSGLSTTVKGSIIQTKTEKAAAFITAYDETGRLIGISRAEASNGIVAELALSMTEMPSKAKLAVFDSIQSLNRLAAEVTLQE